MRFNIIPNGKRKSIAPPPGERVFPITVALYS